MNVEANEVEVLKRESWTWVEEVEDDNPHAWCGRRRRVEREVEAVVWRRGDEVGWTVKVDGDVRRSEVHDTLCRDPDALWTVAEQTAEMVNCIGLHKWGAWRNWWSRVRA